MALNHLQSLVLRVAPNVVDNVNSLVGKMGAMRDFTAFLFYPRHDSPNYRMADADTRLGLGSAKHCGTARAVARAGRSECWANLSCLTLARNSRGAILSGWSWPLATTATPRPGYRQDHVASESIGSAYAQG